MKECKTLREYITEAAEMYERLSQFEQNRADRIKDKHSDFYNEIHTASKYNEGRAKAMREALEALEMFLG